MPGNILNADTGFPQFTESTTEEQKIDQIMNYLYMLLEQLRYTLGNLDSDNFNETGLQELADGIARPLETSFRNELIETNARIEGISNEYGSQIKLLTDWKSEASETIAEISQTAGENAAQISLLTQWKSDTESSIAGLQATSTNQDARITALANWQSGTGEELVNSVAALELEADETGAALELLVTYDSAGNLEGVNAASIALAVSKDESFIQLIADRVSVEGVVTFESLESDGGSVINGNNLSLISDAYGDSISKISFWFEEKDAGYKEMASIYSLYDTIEDDEIFESDYSLVISTETFKNSSGNLRDAALWLKSAAGMKLVAGTNGSGGIKFSCPGRILAEPGRDMFLQAPWGTRILAEEDYSYYSGQETVPTYAYIFCADGIYYNGYKVVSTPG